VISNANREGKRDMKYVGKLDQMLLIKVILPPLNKYNCFQPAKWHSIFSIMSSQTDLAFKEAQNGRPKYFIGKEDTMHPRIRAKPSTLSTLPTGTNSNLAKLIIKPKTSLKQKNK
jgi:hypothetical protein